MKIAAAAVVAVVFASAALAAQGPRRDGTWEVTMQMEMPNMPAGMTMPPMKSTQCITKEQANDPKNLAPGRPQRGGQVGSNDNCTFTDYKEVGNKVTWSMKCGGAQPMSGTGEITYSADSYVGQMVMNIERGGQSMQVTNKYNGKRTGDCVK
jgi:hypothetical protein